LFNVHLRVLLTYCAKTLVRTYARNYFLHYFYTICSGKVRTASLVWRGEKGSQTPERRLVDDVSGTLKDDRSIGLFSTVRGNKQD